MTTWNELRTVALVGTERRPLDVEPADNPATGGIDAALPAELSNEHRALTVAAVLGAGRLAGVMATSDSKQMPEEASADTGFAPASAVQLLELVLTGNTGPGTMSDALLRQWLLRCHEADVVVPHRLLVALLEAGTTTAALRDPIRPVLGPRGRWLATQRDRWSWASGVVAGVERADDATNLAAVLELRADDRDVALIGLRQSDPTYGRDLIAAACEQLDATSRARVLGCLHSELSSADEDLLEAALDDRSTKVRATAIRLLTKLPTSARAERLSRTLEPLVSIEGRIRRSLHVEFPAPPEDEQLRDLPPDGRGVIEQQWFDAIVAGTPLQWWEQTLERRPAEIVAMKSNRRDELHAAWRMAAVTQANAEWIEALLAVAPDASLVALLQRVEGPWSPGFSRRVLDWVRHTNNGKGAQSRLTQVQLLLADRLDTSTQHDITSWLNQVRGDDQQALQRGLRNVIQQLSMRNNIDAAFDSATPTEP